MGASYRYLGLAVRGSEYGFIDLLFNEGIMGLERVCWHVA